MHNPQVLKGRFDKYYRIVTHRDGRVPSQLQAMSFFDCECAERFLRGFNVDERFWHRLAFSLDVPIAYDSLGGTPLKPLSRLLMQGRLRIYEIEGFERVITTTAKRTVRDKSGNALRFAPASALLISTPREQKQFSNIEEAVRFIDQLVPDPRALAELCESVDLPVSPVLPGKSAQGAHPARGLAQALVNGQVIVMIERAYLKPPASAKAEAVLTNVPGLRPVSLAPVTIKQRTWVEVKLLDDDGKPVAGASCRVQDCEGNEFTVKTNAQGVARVNGITPGTCSVSFPELDGWEPA